LSIAGYFPAPLGGPTSGTAPDRAVPRYAAPEVLDGAPPSAASDVFSLGLVAFELFTGRRLLETQSSASARQDLDLLGAAVGPVLRRHPGVPPKLVPVLA